MAKSRKRKVQEKKQKGVEKKFLLISLIVTILLMAIIYIGYK